MYQKTILIGRVTKVNPGVTKPNKKPQTKFGIVTTSSRFDKVAQEYVEDEQFHRLVSYNQVAEHLGSKIVPGDVLQVEGEIRYSHSEDEQGNKKYFTEIVVTQFPKKLPRFWTKDSQNAVCDSFDQSQPHGYDEGNHSFQDDVPLQAH